MLSSQFSRNICHYIALSSAFAASAFMLNNFLTHIFALPGLYGTRNAVGVSFDTPEDTYGGFALFIGIFQSLTYVAALVYPYIILRSQSAAPRSSALMNNAASQIVSAAFWAVMLIGIVDAAISFVRIENMLPSIVGADLALSLGKPSFRGVYVHMPLLFAGIAISFMRRGVDFIWLASLIVFGELLIVITRFIFSYEQAFMGDLVRFWYAALFLFASAYTLVHDGHVRVDVIYATFSDRAKACTNIFGSLILGLPLCWIVVARGLWGPSSPFNLALLNFEVTQQGFGMYVKYLMSGFLIIFAISMLFQFASVIIKGLNVLENNREAVDTGALQEMVS